MSAILLIFVLFFSDGRVDAQVIVAPSMDACNQTGEEIGAQARADAKGPTMVWKCEDTGAGLAPVDPHDADPEPDVPTPAKPKLNRDSA